MKQYKYVSSVLNLSIFLLAKMIWPGVDPSQPDEVQEWFANNLLIFQTWNRFSDAQRLQMDRVVATIVGRHPNAIHPENWPLVTLVWAERWNVMQLFEGDEPPMAPSTPKVMDYASPGSHPVSEWTVE